MPLMWHSWGLFFPGGSLVKNLATNVADPRVWDLIPRLGRSCGEGNGNPFQYPCLENPMKRGAWWAMVHTVTNSWTHFYFNSTLNVWQNSPVKPSSPGLLFIGRFLITESIFLLIISLFRLSISSWFSSGRLHVSKNFSTSSRFQFVSI